MSLLGATAITAGAAIAGQAVNAYAQGKMNKRAVKFNKEMYARQRGDALSDWHMQNAYNDPSAQMQRLQAAGLNPHLVYGSGADAQMSAPIRQTNSQAPNFVAPKFDLGSVVTQALSTKQIQSNIARTDAETDAIKQKTEVGQFQLNAMRAIDESKFKEQLEAKMVNATSQDIKGIREYDAWLQTALNTSSDEITIDQFGMVPTNSRFVNDSVQIATKKAIEEYNRLIKGNVLLDQQNSINQLEMILKRAEASFTQSLGSKTGAGMALQLLRILLGK